MTPAPLHLAGERLMLCPSGVMLWPARRLMAVADLHLEKASHWAARGRHLPPYDSRETLLRLSALMRRYAPRQVVLLGDSFHDPAAPTRLGEEERALLARILAAAEVTWVLGNHDPVPPEGLPGEAVAELWLGPILFRHVGGAVLPRSGAAEVSGHFHPKASLETRAGRISRPCFLADAQRLILPAFGALAGGLDVRAPPLAALMPRGGRVFLLGRERLFSAPLAACAA
ncbi:MAG: ligase-associated DNA damage response endonuclease PdeM [Rhodovarius sp.]|nr:ligase-associated DNA damage response endonuclease PdeM [Rhodovarius sp.]MCX7931742.1 ligase-associated DNA damage response endonuclease PdeM [Rhodovarius sp.]MDW8313974.1 ligase-associated DNA damage response endonuclease PdeM [Rhodovarius sp.]